MKPANLVGFCYFNTNPFTYICCKFLKMETNRTITGLDTIPNGAQGTGKASAALNSNMVEIALTTWVAANKDFEIGDTAGGSENLWLYIPSTAKALKILATDIQRNETDGTVKVFVYLEESFGAAVVTQDFEVVNGNLRVFSILNSGNAAGTIATSNSGTTPIAIGQSVTRVKEDTGGDLLDVVVVNGTGTTLLVEQQYQS
jgi:hypothetical protein